MVFQVSVDLLTICLFDYGLHDGVYIELLPKFDNSSIQVLKRCVESVVGLLTGLLNYSDNLLF